MESEIELHDTVFMQKQKIFLSESKRLKGLVLRREIKFGEQVVHP